MLFCASLVSPARYDATQPIRTIACNPLIEKERERKRETKLRCKSSRNDSSMKQRKLPSAQDGEEDARYVGVKLATSRSSIHSSLILPSAHVHALTESDIFTRPEWPNSNDRYAATEVKASEWRKSYERVRQLVIVTPRNTSLTGPPRRMSERATSYS